MTKVAATPDDLVTFLRKKDYKLVRELGQGACGKTVLLYDAELEQHFVCKKYLPYEEKERSTLFLNFLREIKLLHQVLHPNVVRIFNCFVYADSQTGYILMEHVNGQHIDEFVRDRPEKLAEVFKQTIEGFAYLETLGILHRDIRPANLLVREDGVVKIIDLGFAKKVSKSSDFGKSITLNWGFDPPQEFAIGRYDFATEVYFLGKLFERIIADNRLEQFPDGALLGRMCQHNPADRPGTFREVLATLQKKQFSEIDFSGVETQAYRAFAQEMRAYLVSIDSGATYADNGDVVLRRLEDAYQSVMLEEKAPENSRVLGCFVRGQYRYKRDGFRVSVLRNFLHLLRGCGHEKRRILLANISASLDAIPRMVRDEDDIPF